MRLPHRQVSRRAATAPFFAILIIILLGMTAFSVDVGYMVVVQNELQNAADSAALAGASQLMLPQVSGTNKNSLASTAVTNATTEAQKFSLLNTGGGVYLNLASSDVTIGTQASSGGAVTAWSSGSTFPNAVQVTVRRSSSVNGPLSLFFGPVLGTPTWTGSATATATYSSASYTVTGFNPGSSSTNPLLLPITVNVDTWKTLVTTGQSPDGTIHDDYTAVLPTSTTQAPNNVTTGGDGIPELTGVYPDNTTPGNFGLLDIGPPANDSPTFENWILNGPSPSDMAYFGSNGLQATAASPATLKGGPGWKSVLQTDLQAIIGQPRIIPLYSSYTGQGSNTYYTIVGFAGVTIVNATGRGSNEVITFQPMIAVDTTATTTAGAPSTQTFVYQTTPLGLTR
jgi:Flp pilus assembly protein TadG